MHDTSQVVCAIKAALNPWAKSMVFSPWTHFIDYLHFCFHVMWIYSLFWYRNWLPWFRTLLHCFNTIYKVWLIHRHGWSHIGPLYQSIEFTFDKSWRLFIEIGLNLSPNPIMSCCISSCIDWCYPLSCIVLSLWS